jgi:TonB family protein
MMIAAIGRDVDAISGSNHTNARIVSAAPAEIPVVEGLQNLGGRSEIVVQLDADGKLTGASVKTTSGRRRFDESALRAVRSSTFAPERIEGRPVAGSYLVDVTFDPGQ